MLEHWNPRLNDRRIFGMPVQFVTVVSISLALTIYFGAWAADARVDARDAQSASQNAQQFSFQSATDSSPDSGLYGGLDKDADGDVIASQGWEKFFLYACPLH